MEKLDNRERDSAPAHLKFAPPDGLTCVKRRCLAHGHLCPAPVSTREFLVLPAWHSRLGTYPRPQHTTKQTNHKRGSLQSVKQFPSYWTTVFGAVRHARSRFLHPSGMIYSPKLERLRSDRGLQLYLNVKNVVLLVKPASQPADDFVLLHHVGVNVRDEVDVGVHLLMWVSFCGPCVKDHVPSDYRHACVHWLIATLKR